MLHNLHGNRQEWKIGLRAALRREQAMPYLLFLADQQYRCQFFNATYIDVKFQNVKER